MKQTCPYTLIYEDDAVVALNKASGLLVAADRWDAEAPRLDTLAAGQFGKLYAVHRIDKDTSGLVIYARTAQAHKAVSLAFENRQVEKTYHALVHGRPLWKELDVDLKLETDGDARHRTAVNRRDGKPSLTHFRLIGTCGPFSWIEAKPVTGRTHQIRVHLMANGLHIVCDPLYSGNQQPVYLSRLKRSWHGDTFEERPLLSRLALHARSLTLPHPVTGERVTFTAPYGKDMDVTRKQLKKLFGVDPLEEDK